MSNRKLKRRRPGTGTLRERSPGHWEIKFDLPPDGSGKRRSRFTTFRGTAKAAEGELRRLLSEVEKGVEIDPRLTVATFLERWLKGRAKIGAATRERYEALINRHIVPAIGAVHLAKLTSLRLEELYGELADNGLGAVTIKHVDRLLHTALEKAVQDRLISSNPVDHAETPEPDQKNRAPLTDDEYNAVLGAAKNTRYHAPLVVILGCGIRRGELLALTWRNVDLEAGVLRVVQAVEETKAHGLRFKGPKSTSGRRRVDLPAFVTDVLRDHRHQQRQEHLALGRGWTPDILVFGDPVTGGIWSPGGFTHKIRRLAASVGVKFSPHAGRHEHFSRLLAAGCHPKVAQLRAGHSSIKTTMDLYSHATDALQREAAQKMNDAYEEIRASGGKLVANAGLAAGENSEKL